MITTTATYSVDLSTQKQSKQGPTNPACLLSAESHSSSFHFLCPHSNITEMRKMYKDAFLKKHNIKLGFMSAFVKAAAYALADQPAVNGGTDSS